jgi:hypothetical protein
MRKVVRRGAWLSLLILSACGSHERSGSDPLDIPLAKGSKALTVGGVAQAGKCSTSPTLGLSRQIVEVVNCLEPGVLVPLPKRDNIEVSSATLPVMEKPARDRLLRVVEKHPKKKLRVNSMMRTVVSQHLLKRWHELGSCGIRAAARPGGSNHESGLALDISSPKQWRKHLKEQGFEWFGAKDAVHFDYAGPKALDLRSLNVLAFQMLWNANHPDDLIGLDGEYGPTTAERLEKAPAKGFLLVPSCEVAAAQRPKKHKAEALKPTHDDDQRLAENEGTVDTPAVLRQAPLREANNEGCSVAINPGSKPGWVVWWLSVGMWLYRHLRNRPSVSQQRKRSKHL